MRMTAAQKPKSTFESMVRRELPFSALAHTRRYGSGGVTGHVWDEYVATRPGQNAMRRKAAELVGADKVASILEMEALEQRAVVDSAEEDKLVRLSIAASFRRGDAHLSTWCDSTW